jgi:hypothetical protein
MDLHHIVEPCMEVVEAFEVVQNYFDIVGYLDKYYLEDMVVVVRSYLAFL